MLTENAKSLRGFNLSSQQQRSEVIVYANRRNPNMTWISRTKSHSYTKSSWMTLKDYYNDICAC